MKALHGFLTAAAIGALIAPVAASAASATPHKARHHRAKVTADASDRVLLSQEVSQLRAEVNALHQELASQQQAEAANHTAIANTEAQVGAISTQVAAAPAEARAVAHTEVASALASERHKDHVDYRGLSLKLGGFLAMEGVYRQHYQGNDIASSFAVPFPADGTTGNAYNTSEARMSARQSRISLLAQGKPSDSVTLSGYYEMDFLGGAQTANSKESNSYNPRIRNLYTTIDWNHGDSAWHLLAGQNWSLVTMNTKGITPRNELTPPQIDAQYVPGFVWARQPQVRLTGDFFDHSLWIAVSAENSQTIVGGSAPASVVSSVTAGSGFDSANTLSLNGTPDFVAKVAYEGKIAGHSLHLEGFALDRTFTAAVITGSGPSALTASENRGGYGLGGGVVLQAIPDLLDIQFSGMVGKGIGRYGSAQLSDVTFDTAGNIHAIKETMLLGGATLHATKMLDIYAFAGEELASASNDGTYGIGLAGANNSGCFIAGDSSACKGATRRVRQLTAGFWQKIYSGDFGRAQVGIQYSYTQRELFAGTGATSPLPAYSGMPQVSQNMGLFSIRYYPF